MSAYAVPGTIPGRERAVCLGCPHFQRGENTPEAVAAQIATHNGIYHPETLAVPEPPSMALDTLSDSDLTR